MKRYLVIAFLTLLALALLAAVVLGVVLATLNPNEYKDDISALVERETGKQLIFQGDIETTLFPSLGLKTGRLRLNDAADFGAEPFVSVESASFKMAVLPLLSGRIEIKEIVLDGLALKLMVASSGRSNWDLSAPGSSPSAPQPSDSGVTPLQDTAPKPVREEKSNAKPMTLEVDSLTCTKAVVTYRDMAAGGSYRLGVDSLALSNVRPGQDMSAALEGEAEDLNSGQKARLSLKAVVRVDRGRSITGKLEKCILTATGKGPSLDLSLQAALLYAMDKRTLDLQDIKGTIDKTDFSGTLAATLPHADNKGLGLRGKLDVGELDLDSLLVAIKAVTPEEKTGQPVAGSLGVAKPAGGSARPAPVKDKDAKAPLSPALRALDADLALTAKGLTVAKLPFKDVQAQVSAASGKAEIPYSMKLFGGHISGTATADLAPASPLLTLNATAGNLPMGDIMATLTGKRSVGGTLGSSLNVRGKGLAWKDLAPTLAGKAAFQVTGGSVEGFRLVPQGLPGVQPFPVNFPLERISTSFAIADGIATTRDFLMLSPVIKGTGSGAVNLVREALDFRAEFMLVGLPPAVPLDIAGPFTAISYKVNMPQLLKNTATDVFSTPGAAGEILKEVPGAAGKALEGIFRRGK